MSYQPIQDKESGRTSQTAKRFSGIHTGTGYCDQESEYASITDLDPDEKLILRPGRRKTLTSGFTASVKAVFGVSLGGQRYMAWQEGGNVCMRLTSEVLALILCVGVWCASAADIYVFPSNYPLSYKKLNENFSNLNTDVTFGSNPVLVISNVAWYASNSVVALSNLWHGNTNLFTLTNDYICATNWLNTNLTAKIDSHTNKTGTAVHGLGDASLSNGTAFASLGTYNAGTNALDITSTNRYLPRDGSLPMTGPLDMNNKIITNVLAVYVSTIRNGDLGYPQTVLMKGQLWAGTTNALDWLTRELRGDIWTMNYSADADNELVNYQAMTNWVINTITGSLSTATNWSLYSALQTVNMGSNDLNQVRRIYRPNDPSLALGTQSYLDLDNGLWYQDHAVSPQTTISFKLRTLYSSGVPNYSPWIMSGVPYGSMGAGSLTPWEHVTNILNITTNALDMLSNNRYLHRNGSLPMTDTFDVGSTYSTSNGILNCDFISGRTNGIFSSVNPSYGLLLCVGTNIFAYGSPDNSFGKDILLISHGVNPSSRGDVSSLLIWSNAYGAQLRLRGQPERSIELTAGKPAGFKNQNWGYVSAIGYGGHGAELLVSSNVIVKTPFGSTGAVVNLYVKDGYARCPNFTTSLSDCLVNWTTLSSYYNSSTNYAYSQAISVSNYASSISTDAFFLTNGARVMNGNIVFTNWSVGFYQVTPGISNCNFVAGGGYNGSLYLTPGGSDPDNDGVIAYGYRTNFTIPTDLYTAWDYDRGSRIAAIGRYAFLQAGTGGIVEVSIGGFGDATMTMRTNSIYFSNADVVIENSRGLSVGGETTLNSNLLAGASNKYDIGTLAVPFRSIYLGTETIFMDGVPVMRYDSVASQLVSQVSIVTQSDTNQPPVGYLTNEATFLASVAYRIAAGDTNNWSLAYGWGNHATNGYATTSITNGLNTNDASTLSSGILPMGRLTAVGTNIAGAVLITDGAGNRSWTNAPTISAGNMTGLTLPQMPSGVVTNASGSSITNISIWTGTTAAYQSLSVTNANTLYFTF